jgi:enoyl-[acyl-carrier-protein] reductase (NADH)
VVIAHSGHIRREHVEDATRQAAAGTALGRMVTACDVADAALFLASDLSSGITGALVPVDAGSR